MMGTPKTKASRPLRSNSQPDTLLTEIMGLKKDIESSKQEVIKTIGEEIDSLKKTISFLSNRVTQLEQQNEFLTVKCDKMASDSDFLADMITEECEQRRIRERNIFIVGLPEATFTCSSEPNDGEAHEQDRKVIQDLLDSIGAADANVSEWRRVGRVSPASGASRKRPLLIKFSDARHKWKVLKGASKLRKIPRFSSVYLNADLTQQQQFQRKKLMMELNARRKDGEDVVLFRNKVILRDSIHTVSKNDRQFFSTRR